MYIDNLLEKIPMEICLFAVADLHIVQANQSARENLGYSMAELDKLTLPELVVNMTTEKLTDITEPLRLGRTDYISFRTQYKRKDGSAYPVDIQMYLADYESVPVLAAATIDITEHIQTTEKLEQSQAHIKVLNRLLAISLKDMPFDEMLPAFIDEIISVPWLDLEHKGAIFLVEDEPDVLVLKAGRGLDSKLVNICGKVPFGKCLCGRAALLGQVVFADSIDERHDNRFEGMLPHGHYCCPIMSGENKVVGILYLYTREKAVSDEKIKEGFLLMAASLLAGIIERKSSQAGTAALNEQLREHARLKSDFVMTMTHELRTPLTIFKGIISNSLENVYGKISPTLRGKLEIAEESIGRLARIVSNLLDISKIDAGRMEFNPEVLSVQSLVLEAVETSKPVARVKGVNISCNMPDKSAFVLGDRRLLLQVLTNLIQNAIKFLHDTGGNVLVRAIGLGDVVRIEVEDNGPGIESGKIDKLFTRFGQTQKQLGPGDHGTGLGLAICREIIIMHNGHIGVKSTPGQGSVFSFIIPLHLTADEETREQDKVNPAGSTIHSE